MATSVFSSEQLNAAIVKTLPLVPAGHDNAIIGTVDQAGAQVVLTVKIADVDDRRRFAVNGIARHDWTGNNEVGASVIYSWKS